MAQHASISAGSEWVFQAHSLKVLHVEAGPAMKTFMKCDRFTLAAIFAPLGTQLGRNAFSR